MPLIDRIRMHAEFHATLAYGRCSNGGHCFHVTPVKSPLTTRRGIYFLLSHKDTRIQKVGLANGNGGLRQRMAGYERCYGGNGQDGDRTMALWYRVMTDPSKLKGQKLRLWFVSFSRRTKIHVLGEDYSVLCDPHQDLERQLSKEARNEGHPLLLMGGRIN